MRGRTAEIIVHSLGEDYDVRAEVGRLDGHKVLILHGDRDPIDPASLHELAAAIGARMELIAGSGHVPYLEVPDTFFAMLRGFLGEPT